MLLKNKIISFLILTIFFLPQPLKAQSLRGKKIYISPSREVMIKFPSEITDFNIQNKKSASHFETRIKNRKHLYINSNVPAFKTTSLIVKERWNTHIFILQYKETLEGVTETVYDYSSPKVMAEEARKLQETLVKVRARSSSGGPDARPPVGTVTDTAPATAKIAGKAIVEDYTELEMKANVAFTTGKLDEAKDLYQKALKLQPNAQWPAWQLSKIEAKKLADARKVCDFCYMKYKTTGDSAFNKKSYSLAKSAYSQALRYKSADRYLSSQIAKIEKLEKDKLYTQFMKMGREALTSSSLSEAASAFQEALNLRFNDAEAKKGLAAVAGRRTALFKKAEAANKNVTKLSQYRDTLAIADQLFNAASYEAAKKVYKKAEELNPAEPYTRKKIAEIDSILLVRNQVLERLKKDSANAVLYTSTIGKADKAFEAGEVKKAKSLYQSAKQFRTDDRYAAQRISAIDAILLEEDERRKAAAAKQLKTEAGSRRYNDLVREGNAAFAGKQYEDARDYFLGALAIRPSETVPRTQIDLINRKLEEQRKEERYKYFIHLADSNAFQVRNLLQALRYYDSAHTLKPQEMYPKKQIVFMNDKLRTSSARAPEQRKQRKRTEKFNEAVKVYRKADEARIERKYPEAYTGYSAFLNQLDTANVNLYLMSELYYINQAKDYIQQLERLMPQPLQTMMEIPQEDKRKRANVKNNK